MSSRIRLVLLSIVVSLIFFGVAYAAYDHGGADTDSSVFLDVFPDMAGTKLDSCALCHTGGTYLNNKGNEVALGSCQWCHYVSDYDPNYDDFEDTLNPYGMDYLANGRDADALDQISVLDSDGDGFSNSEEIAAVRFPGNADDDPLKVEAPYRIFTREELATYPLHSQFILMNTHKSGDYYAEYSGVPVARVLDDAGILSSAAGITVYAPDGWAQYHPLESNPDPLLYHVYGTYPQADFYYDEEADAAKTPYGWCDYSAPSAAGRINGDPIQVEDGLQMLLAFKRDGADLEPGELNLENKLDGEGPFRIVPPQKSPGPPDQSSKLADMTDIIWPFDATADHNAGFASRSATMIRVEPLPEGTTDIDILEAGWNYVDEGKIIIYGSIDPVPTIATKLDELTATLWAADSASFKHCILKWMMTVKCALIKKLVDKGAYKAAMAKIEHDLLKKTDGVVKTGVADRNDWITDQDLQKSTYWAIHEISVLFAILK